MCSNVFRMFADFCGHADKNHICTVRDDHYPFAGWISGRIVSLQSDTDIQKLLSNGNRVRIRISESFYRYFEDSDFWKKLHITQSFIDYLQKYLFSLLCHDFESVYGVISVPKCNPIPPLNLLNGHAKFVSMNLFLMWQDRALSAAYTLRTLFAVYLYLN